VNPLTRPDGHEEEPMHLDVDPPPDTPADTPAVVDDDVVVTLAEAARWLVEVGHDPASAEAMVTEYLHETSRAIGAPVYQWGLDRHDVADIARSYQWVNTDRGETLVEARKRAEQLAQQFTAQAGMVDRARQPDHGEMLERDARTWAERARTPAPFTGVGFDQNVDDSALRRDLGPPHRWVERLGATGAEADVVDVVDDLNDQLGVEAGQMIAAREIADTALASHDLDALADALGRMGVPAEDNPALLAQALLALPPAVQLRRLDQLEVLNTRDSDQAAVLAHQRGRPATRPAAVASMVGHPARVAAAAVDKPTDAAVQRHRPDIGNRAADVVPRSPHPRSASADRQSTPKR
jgi:hypothetical protein